MRRVAVTGIGVICALGHDLRQTWNSLGAGKSGIAPLANLNGSVLRFQNGAEVRGFTPESHFEASHLLLLDRFAQFALVAARQAVGQSGIEFSPRLRQRTAVVTGSSLGGKNTEDAQFLELYGREGRIHPLTIPRSMANAGASVISMEWGLTGPAYTLSTACSSSNHAIGQAFWMVRHGLADAAITGGSEASFSLGTLKAWEAMRVISPDTCRPFSKDRRGMILGEGGAMLVLEPLEIAQARGARVFGEVVGFGMSSDASHMTQPSVDGPAQAMHRALEDAGISAEAIGYINAHGTATPINDSTEVRAIRRAFHAQADRLAVSSTKSMHGHALGAAGALEAVATLMALYDGVLPPTANYNQQDPECDLDIVPNQARRAHPEYALSNSFAFGGLNAVLVFRAP